MSDVGCRSSLVGYRATMPGPSDIATIVNSYIPDGDEISVGIAIDALGSGRPMWTRSEFDPGHFTASGFVASPDHSSLLLFHHGTLRRWLRPGGHLESEDLTIEDSARREIAEETGLSEIDRVGTSLMRVDAHPIPERGPEPGHIHIDLALGFVARTDDIAVVDEILDARWVPFDRLGEYDVDSAVTHGAATLLRSIANG
jgi:8-oxo-dGTP pyrophosphatase MutT (NUDIX family)